MGSLDSEYLPPPRSTTTESTSQGRALITTVGAPPQGVVTLVRRQAQPEVSTLTPYPGSGDTPQLCSCYSGNIRADSRRVYSGTVPMPSHRSSSNGGPHQAHTSNTSRAASPSNTIPTASLHPSSDLSPGSWMRQRHSPTPNTYPGANSRSLATSGKHYGRLRKRCSLSMRGYKTPSNNHHL